MNIPDVELDMYAKILSPWQRYTTNSVIIFVESKSDEILEDPTTGQRTFTGRSTPLHQPVLININLRSFSHGYIYRLLRNKLVNHRWFCGELASEISTAAIELGFGRYGFTMEIFVKFTYQTVVVLPAPSPLNNETLSLRAELLMRMVQLGRIGTEELKSLKMETESCSICLDNLCDPSSSKHGVPTRMTCSHVFHESCLLEWLHRKNTCPLCRTVLYETTIDDLASQLYETTIDDLASQTGLIY